MANYTLRGGEQINLLTQEELRHELDQVSADWFQEQARGFSTHPLLFTGTIASGSLRAPANNGAGPKNGFAWRVDRITASGLTGSDSITVYRNDTVHAVDVITAAKPAIYPGKGLILRSDDMLFLSGTGLTATGDITITGQVTEVPELDLYKVL